MAESFLASVAGKLLEKIASLALEEFYLASGLHEDLNKLEESLKTVKAVLLDAGEKQTQSNALRLWLGRLTNLCYDAEDVVDELESEGLRQRVVGLHSDTKTKVKYFLSPSSSSFPFRQRMGHKVKELRERLDEVAAEKLKFHLTDLDDSGVVGSRNREMTDSLLRTSNVVGRERDKEIIINTFLIDPNFGGGISVIPILGLGGLGKTALAQMIYNDESVQEYFDLRIWVCVSEIFEKKQIMVKMLKCLTFENYRDLDPDQLQMFIREKLKSKKFLIVLDDLWNDDHGKWVEIRDLLEGGADGSKIIVTTRNGSVAAIVRTVPPYALSGLSHGEGLTLLKKLAFREGEEDSHSLLEELGGDIVKKCEGLPLAVRTLGTLLYLNRSKSYWKFIRDNEMWQLPQKETDILPVLRLSYDRMPSYLKSCFKVFAIFPRDFQFNSICLTQFWMALGLLQSSNEDHNIDQTGLRYMRELYFQSFLQDCRESRHFIEVKMNGLVHELSRLVAQSEFCAVNTCSQNISDGIRHVSFSNKTQLERAVPGFLKKGNKLRTIMFPSDLEGLTCECFVRTCISTSKYLRVLELKASLFEVLPNSIGDLVHLRYLDLSENRSLRRLPGSICKLYNLETLFLLNCSALEELPRGIKNLIKLRVFAITVKNLPEDEIGDLKSLHFLFLFYCKDLVSLPRSLKYLTGLKILRIDGCNQLNLKEEDENQDVKVSLESLALESLPLLGTLPEWLKKSFNTLRRLSFFRCDNFSSFPEWFQDFSSLEMLEIKYCPKLLSLPEGMDRLTALKELRIKGCPTLLKRCKKLVGEDWHKIAHISKIVIDDDGKDEALSTA